MGDVADVPCAVVAVTTLLLFVTPPVEEWLGARRAEEAPVVGTGTAITVLTIPEDWAEEEQVLEEATVTWF